MYLELQMTNIILLAASSAIFVAAFPAKFLIKPKSAKKQKLKKTLTTLLLIVSGWLFVGTLFNLLEGKTGISLVIEEFAMFSDRMTVGGVSLAKTTVLLWIVVAVVALLLIAFRLFAVPRFTEDTPKGLQNAIESVVEMVDNFVKGVVGEHLGDGICSYMFAVAITMMGCAFVELFGERAPTSDLTVTFSLGLMTFILINYYGIRQKGIGGRLKDLSSPAIFMFPMKVLSDIAVPVSLACRLFGNMLGGLIVMELIHGSFGGYTVGISSAAGLFFNLFHPAIQTYIFITLSLTFINEAAEIPEE